MRHLLTKILALSALFLLTAGVGPCSSPVPLGATPDGQGPLDGSVAAPDAAPLDAAKPADLGKALDADPTLLCAEAGGVCVGLAPSSCPSGNHWGDGHVYPCGPGIGLACCLPDATVCNLAHDPLPCAQESDCTSYGATCKGGSCACVAMNCTPGHDETCNDDPAISGLNGHCTSFGSCECITAKPKSQTTGKCP